MSKATPAIPLFGDAYIADTRHLSLEEHGAYLQLLMIAWRTDDCSLPDDDKRLAQMLGITVSRWGKIKPTVMAFWEREGDRWTQKRLQKERAFVNKKREQNAEAANARWKGQPVENKGVGECERMSKRTSERNAPPPTYKKPSVSKRASSFPDDWKPEPFGPDTEAARIVAAWPAGEFDRQFERFRDHHRAKGGKFVDWQAAWGTWARNSVQFARPNAPRTAAEPIPLYKHLSQQRQRTASGG